jgi:hypothetical protein
MKRGGTGDGRGNGDGNGGEWSWVERTRLSCWKISLPFGVNWTSWTAVSQPSGFRPTLTPMARPTIWWPKQTPMMRTRSWARTWAVKETSVLIQGESSKELCP